MDTKELIKTRDEYIKRVKSELLGPGSEVSIPDAEHELLSTAPDIRYSMGILFPKGNKINADNNDSNKVEESAVTDDDDEDDSQDDLTSETKSYSEGNSPEEDNLDEEISLATQNMPSSLGFTFFADGNVEYVQCKVKFATYRKAVPKDCRMPFKTKDPDNYSVPDFLKSYIYFDKKELTIKYVDKGLNRKEVRSLVEKDLLEGEDQSIINIMYSLSDQFKKGYVREPHEETVKVVFNDRDYVDENRNLSNTKAKITALKKKISNDISSITLMLVNDDSSESEAKKCLFQPEIMVNTEGNAFKFVDYSRFIDIKSLDEEEQSLVLQYRNKLVYGTGLGTSVGWNINKKGEGVIYNDFFPEAEVPSMDFSLSEEDGVAPITLSMKYLSDLNSDDKTEKINHLKTLVSSYQNWIDGLSKKIKSIDKRLVPIANKNISGCRDACERMYKGIETLEKDTIAWDSFQLANRAMYMQRVQLKIQEKFSDVDRYPGDEELEKVLTKLDYYTIDSELNDKFSWRPFQLAFLLMSINSVTSDNSGERDIVDLIWFPTGGGKTEAYLGLTALTIFYRKMKWRGKDAGTSVIMRYTLRLLAAQQFTRASTLICACEYIRDDSARKKPKYAAYDLGKEPITIGLWIGDKHTPNKKDDAKKFVKGLLMATASNLKEAKEKNNKFQVLKCPWCGTKLTQDVKGGKKVGVFGYRADKHFEIFCPQDSCYFGAKGKLPIQVVDEELYDNPPSLLFGTVDKFAMLPWRSEIGNFFAVNSNNRAPELIIQDELHLISGPLGTMVGLYETALDYLCSAKGTPIKIIASTATIRRAKEQCSALYNRKVNQFPHPGIDSEDSYFAKESIIDYKKGIFGRKYVGIMPSGKTKAMMEVRSMAAMLQTINVMNLPDEVKDKFWTLTVYFNSLKDLGKCTTLVDDDIKDFIKRMAFRTGNASDARLLARADELTSRVSTTELNETLDKLEKIQYSKANIEAKRYPSNVLLATNMISVGIDVARLNVMLLVGQPKLTSEYIQASSRVGRTYPGVAFALYDGSKSRDRSHYEQFKAYHDSFYRYVEPTGATPFSKPARDRALHAIVACLLRLLEPSLTDEKNASQFNVKDYEDDINKIKEYIVNRNNQILERLDPDRDNDEEAILSEIDRFLNDWEVRAKQYPQEHFFYGEKFLVKNPDSENDGRLLKVYNTSPNDPAYNTMTSMRNVDSTVAGNILVWEDKQ